MSILPDPTESLERLHRAGWSVGEVGTGRSTVVSGSNGENRLWVAARTSAEAWFRACEQAEALGMLRLS